MSQTSDLDEMCSLMGMANFENWAPHDNPSFLDTFGNELDDESNAKPPKEHPLLNSIVLENVFNYVDRVSGKSQRHVCRIWNEELIRILSTPHTCRSSKDIKNLLSLVSNPSSPSPFLRSLSLRYNELWKTPETFQLLWSVQDDLKVLEIAAIELEYCPLMVLPRVCPGLQKLKLSCTDIYPEVNWDQLEPFEANWVRPFPNLRELEIQRGSLTRGSVALIISLLQRVPTLDVIQIQVDTGFGRDDGIQVFGQELIRNPKIFQRLKRLNIGSYNCNGFMTGITEELGVRPSFTLNLSSFSLVQKTGTLFPPISIPHMERALSLLVQEASRTLKQLTIVNSCETHPTQDVDVGKLVFPETMPRLEFLCLGNVGLLLSKVTGKGTGGWRKTEVSSRGFSKLFPKLGHFEYWIRIFNDISDEDKEVLFEAMFPKEEKKRGSDADVTEGNNDAIHKNLRNFHMYTRLKPGHEMILKKISAKFSSLQSLMLEMDGELLAKAVGLLKDLPISHFTLIYYETANGMVDFDAATTGVPLDICTQLLMEIGDNHNYVLDMEQISRIKTAASFVDWKCLTRLNVSYRHGGVFDVIFLTYCLRLMKNLLHLEIRHFDIKENLLIRLIKKSALDTLTLGNCRVIPIDEDYPVIGHDFGIEDLIAKYKKGVKVSFVGYEGTSDIDSIPYYAQLLHHFEYDSYAAGNF